MRKGLLASFLLATGIMFSGVAVASPVVVVSSSSGIDALTESQVRQIFNGQLRRISGVSVKPLDLPAKNDSRDDFYQAVMGKSAEQIKSYWARMIFTGRGMPPREVSSEREMVVLIASDQSYVGYVDEAKVPAGVKVVYRP